MLWIFVLAIIMPISLSNCDDNLAIIKWDHAVNSKSKLDAALKSDIQFIEADVVLGTITGKATVAVPTGNDGDADEVQDADAAAGNLAEGAKKQRSGGSTNNEEEKDDKADGKGKKPEGKEGEGEREGEVKPEGGPDSDTDSTHGDDGNNKNANKKKAKNDIPIMAHPPDNTGDLSLEDFLKTVADYNEKNTNNTKGVKLDFKTIEALEKSIVLLKKEVKAPLWINSDILDGPGDKKGTPVDSKKFFEAVKSGSYLDKATLSIGWTTHVEKDKKGNYADSHVDAMIKVIDDNIKGSSHPISFPVRAIFAAESKDTLHKLYDHVSKENKEKVTFTVWSAAGDDVDTDKLQDFISSFGVDKVYVDVPEDLKKKLNLNGASSIAAFGLFNVVAVVVALFLRNGLH